MIARINLARILGLLVVVALILGWIAVAPVAGADLVPPLQETPAAEEPAATEAPAEEPAATEPPAEEPAATEPAAEPAPEEPPAEPEQPQGGLSTFGTLVIWGIVGVVGLAFIAIIVVLLTRPGKGAEEAPLEAPSVPITTLAEDIKEGRVSKIVVSGEELTITRLDGLVLVSRKEPTADLVQVLTNLGVTPEMMSTIIIEVETPETQTG